MTDWAISLKAPIWLTCGRGKACLFPCFSADELYTPATRLPPPTRGRVQQGLNDTHFDAFLKHFREALEEVGVEADKAEKVMKLLESKRNAVLNR